MLSHDTGYKHIAYKRRNRSACNQKTAKASTASQLSYLFFYQVLTTTKPGERERERLRLKSATGNKSENG